MQTDQSLIIIAYIVLLFLKLYRKRENVRLEEILFALQNLLLIHKTYGCSIDI